MPAHDGCEMPRELEAQRIRHHEALNRITEVTCAIQRDQRLILDHLVGTFERPGLVHRVAALESRNRVAWWTERGTKVVDVLIAGLVVGAFLLLLKIGFQGAIRDIIREGSSDVSMAIQTARKAPKDPGCQGCAPTVADAR